jgi:hypothetical protein
MSDQPGMSKQRLCEILVQQTETLREELREIADMVKIKKL